MNHRTKSIVNYKHVNWRSFEIFYRFLMAGSALLNDIAFSFAGHQKTESLENCSESAMQVT